MTTVFRVCRSAVTPAASSTSLSMVPPWTNPIGLASLGSIWDDRMDLDWLTGFEGLMLCQSSSRRNLALSPPRNNGFCFAWAGSCRTGAGDLSSLGGVGEIFAGKSDFFWKWNSGARVFDPRIELGDGSGTSLNNRF